MTIAYSPELVLAKSRNLRSIVIVGGGASGVLLAAHLLRGRSGDVRVTIIEKQPVLGRGLAYSTTVPQHVLNVRASNMSAFADDPAHFTRWLRQRGVDVDDPETYFAPRQVYGDYLGELLGPHVESGRLRVIDEECVDVIDHGSFVEARLGNGASKVGDVCVLATGHETGRCTTDSLLTRADDSHCYPKKTTDSVLIAGTGLSMIDTCLALIFRGHSGPIFAVSRRGLLPEVHARTTPVLLSRAEIPLGEDLVTLLRWFRKQLQKTEARGGNWRDVVDGMRPHTQAVWMHLPEPSRRQFFRHLKPWWDVHRHRMAPQVHATISDAIARGQLRPIAARILESAPTSNGAAIRLRRRGHDIAETLEVVRVYDCKGVVPNLEKSSGPLIGALLRSEMARIDGLHIGLDVSAEGALLDRDGKPGDRLFAVGPLTRGAFLEIEAVPDIRVQCRDLAQALLNAVGSDKPVLPTPLASSGGKFGNAVPDNGGI